MKEEQGFGDRIVANVLRNRTIREGELTLKGTYRFTLYRKGELIGDWETKNVITNEGKKMLLAVGLANEVGFAQKTAWYVMLVSNDGPPPTPVATHDYDNFHGTAVTEFTEYAGGARKVYTPVVSGPPCKITNGAARASFTFVTPTKDVYGAALVSNSTHNDSTAGDWLMSWAALPNGVVDAQHDDVLNVEIELAFT